MNQIMNTRYRLIHRGVRQGMYYSLDKQTGKRRSLHAHHASEARQILEAMNIAERQPALNRQIARAYLAGSDSGVNTRTWLDAMEMIIHQKHGSNQGRWRRAVRRRGERGGRRQWLRLHPERGWRPVPRDRRHRAAAHEQFLPVA